MMTIINNTMQFTVVVPAAGVGKRMKTDRPKQYLLINNKTIIEHTIERLLAHPNLNKVIVCISPEDGYFSDLDIFNHQQVIVVDGGKERCDSVLAGLNVVDEEWVLVHDAARPCITHSDINQLINQCIGFGHGAILATPVRDTMKRSNHKGEIQHTEDRDNLWHAQTPQMFKSTQLTQALSAGILSNQNITDEASAIEISGLPCQIVSGREDNIKITRPSDLNLAAFILNQQKEESCA